MSESDFAPGTKWTPVGWTRSNYNSTALQTSVDLSFDNSSQKPIYNGVSTTNLKINSTLNKNDIIKGRNILLGSIQQINEYTKQNKQFMNYTDSSSFHHYNHDIYYKGSKIGYISLEFPDGYEEDLVLHVTDSYNFATDPTISYTEKYFMLFNSQYFSDYRIFNGQKLPVNNYFITPNKVNKIAFNDTNDISEVNPFTARSISADILHGAAIVFFIGPKPNETNIAKVFKVQSTTNNLKLNGSYVGRINSMYQMYNKNNKPTSENFRINYDNKLKYKILKNGLSADEVFQTANQNLNTFCASKQADGSIIGAFNISLPTISLNKKDLEDQINKSYLLNVQDTKDADQITQNTLTHYQNNNYLPYIVEVEPWLDYTDISKPFKCLYTDLTPVDNYGSTSQVYNPSNSTFNAELYRTALVHYFDSKTGNDISNDSIMGVKNDSTDYKLNIPKGYVLDTKSPNNVDGKQYNWSADKESIAYTFNEDQKLNDANPINIYVTHGTHNTNDNSGKAIRTIQYTGLPADLKPKDNVQTILFKRSGVTDDVSGETTYGDWQPQAGNGHYTAVPSPTFAGYKPDQTVVPDTAATAGKDETVTVNYSRTDQNAKLTVHDDTANTDLNDYAENSTGLYQDQINFKTAPSAVEQELKDKGYNIVSDNFKDSPTYNADDSKNNFVIHVTHKIVPVTPDQPKTPTDVIPDTKQHYPTGVDTNDLNKDVQRSIFYKYEDNTQAEPTVVQKAHFSRTVKVDAVTQKIVDNGTWSTKDNYPEVTTKAIDGYTPDKTKVDSAIPSMTTNQDQTVVYHANDEDAAITYIDDTTGKVLKTDTQKAKYKQTIKFATDPNTQIQTYKDQGYILVSSDWKDGSTYQTDPARNKFTVHLKHGTSTVTPDKPKKPTDIIPGTKQHYPTGVDTNDLNQPQQRQITYTYADSKKQASPTVTQKATFHRTATVDNVTGKTTYTDWTTSDQYPEVKSPAIEGYTPDKSNVPATKPELNTKQDVAVVYNPNPEQVDVIAQDNIGKQLSKSTLHGNYNTDYSATTPVIKGYHLIKMPANTHGTYKTHNDPIIYIYSPDSNTVPEQTDGTPKPDKSSYPNDLTPAKRSNKLPETGSITLQSEINSVTNNITHALSHLLH